MVGRLPALKYFEAASSNACHTSSAGCRPDTSACVCTSMAIKSSVFIWRPPSVTCLIPTTQRTALAHQTGEQGRRLPVHGTESVAILENAVINRLEPDGIRVKQRTAAIPWKAIAGAPHHVHVAGARGNSLLEDTDAFIDERIHATLHDLLCVVLALRNGQAFGRVGKNLNRLRIIVPCSVARQVFVITLAVLLPQPAGRVQ